MSKITSKNGKKYRTWDNGIRFQQKTQEIVMKNTFNFKFKDLRDLGAAEARQYGYSVAGRDHLSGILFFNDPFI